MSKAPFESVEAEGAPSFSFAVGYKPEPWNAKAGQSYSIELRIRSNGAKGAGIRVSASGDALKCVSVDSMHVGKKKIKFETVDGKLTAELPEFPVVVGVRYPFPAKPKNDDQKALAKELLDATSSMLKFTGKAKAAGREMLRIEVSVPGSSASALKWIRPFTVE